MSLASPLLVVSDLDGTLLDERTYDFGPARPALAALARHGALLVLASSKTRAEMQPLSASLGLRSPLIVENGGAILLPREGGGYDAVARGVARAALVQALEEVGRETGAPLRGFSSFSAEVLRRLAGLPSEAAARRALERDFDEPFVLEDEAQAAAVAAAAERRGLLVTRGGRFFHLSGATDKGQALRELLALLARQGRSFTTVGLGDAANDLPLLCAVDRPIVVPRHSGSPDPELAAALPGAELAPAPGPGGWNAAVLTVLKGGRLPTVAGGGA
ncbi:MAG TPA: HAD-IIB family hydrolase [Candidatus Limnocylindrales bacterium]|jgi:mannosyl-3-phosphoglycerate phosphatase